MSTKVEAKRFSGKPGQWPHYDLSVRAHCAINDWAKHFHEKVPDADAADRADYIKAQQKIYAYILLTCDDRAATTLLPVPIARRTIRAG